MHALILAVALAVGATVVPALDAPVVAELAGDEELFTVMVIYRDSEGALQTGRSCGIVPRDAAIACAELGLDRGGYRLDIENERGATFVQLDILVEPVRVVWVPGGPL